MLNLDDESYGYLTVVKVKFENPLLRNKNISRMSASVPWKSSNPSNCDK